MKFLFLFFFLFAFEFDLSVLSCVLFLVKLCIVHNSQAVLTWISLHCSISPHKSVENVSSCKSCRKYSMCLNRNKKQKTNYSLYQIIPNTSVISDFIHIIISMVPKKKPHEFTAFAYDWNVSMKRFSFWSETERHEKINTKEKEEDKKYTKMLRWYCCYLDSVLPFLSFQFIYFFLFYFYSFYWVKVKVVASFGLNEMYMCWFALHQLNYRNSFHQHHSWTLWKKNVSNIENWFFSHQMYKHW